MNIMLILGMFPGFLTMILIYKVFAEAGLTMEMAPVGLVIVYCASSGMGYYVSKGFFDTIPKSLDEAPGWMALPASRCSTRSLCLWQSPLLFTPF